MGRDAARRTAASAPVPLDRRRARAHSGSGSSGRATARSASGRPAGCVVAALFVFAVAVLAARFVIPLVARSGRDAAERAHARRLLAQAVRGLPRDRVDWGQAMLAELDQAVGRR